MYIAIRYTHKVNGFQVIVKWAYRCAMMQQTHYMDGFSEMWNVFPRGEDLLMLQKQADANAINAIAGVCSISSDVSKIAYKERDSIYILEYKALKESNTLSDVSFRNDFSKAKAKEELDKLGINFNLSLDNAEKEHMFKTGKERFMRESDYYTLKKIYKNEKLTDAQERNKDRILIKYSKLISLWRKSGDIKTRYI